MEAIKLADQYNYAVKKLKDTMSYYYLQTPVSMDKFRECLVNSWNNYTDITAKLFERLKKSYYVIDPFIGEITISPVKSLSKSALIKVFRKYENEKESIIRKIIMKETQFGINSIRMSISYV